MSVPTGQIDRNNLTDVQEKKWRVARWRCRTDLEWLCQRVLNYKNVEKKVHGPVLDILQKFPTPKNYEEMCKHDKYNRVTGRWEYKPLVEKMIDLPAHKKRRLILDPRGHLKTTINAQAHTIQWILNYPDVAVQVTQSNTEKAIEIVDEIKRHFQYNPLFRQLFPEYCPQRQVDKWGTQAEFTTEARAKRITRKESTVMIGSIDKGTAGLHFDVMKFSDIVEPSNVRTDTMIASVTKAFYMAENLLVAPSYWIDVEGTRYTHNDLYGELIDQWVQDTAEGLEPEYDIHVRGCWKKQFAELEEHPNFTPLRLEEPDLLNDSGEQVPIWEIDNEGRDRFLRPKLLRMKKREAYLFSCQQLNCPVGGIDGMEIFPVNKNRPRFIPVDQLRKVRIVQKEIIVDTAETTNDKSNYSCITVGGWDKFGRLYILDIIHGKWLTDELCRKIIAASKVWSVEDIKIEETSFVRGMMPTLERYMALSKNILPITFIKRENQLAKEERIQKTLQPWYKDGALIFSERIAPRIKEHLKKEFREFPLSKTDDILDTLADFFLGKAWFGRFVDKKEIEREIDYEMQRALGIEDPFNPLGAWEQVPRSGMYHNIYGRTGGL